MLSSEIGDISGCAIKQLSRNSWLVLNHGCQAAQGASADATHSSVHGGWTWRFALARQWPRSILGSKYEVLYLPTLLAANSTKRW
jgi:hypothetical protein